MKKILITGASRGIGYALAAHFAAKGERVCIVSQSRAIHQAAHELKVARLQGDVGYQGELLVERAAAMFEGLDIVLHSAGAFKVENDLRSAMDLVQTNVLGAWNVALAATTHLSTGGSLVLLSGGGVGGLRPGTDCHPLYTASKAAVVQIAECMAARACQLRINAVAPGQVATAMRNGIGDGPERTVACIDWLCSDAAAHVTGRLISAARDGTWDPGPWVSDRWNEIPLPREWGKLRRVMP